MSEIVKLNMIAEWQEQYKQLIEDLDNSKKRIVDLEKENAELKGQCSILADCNTCTSTCKTENIEMKKQLTKAKELIRTLLLVADNKVSQMEFQLCIADAKGFLKDSEVEK